MSSRQICLFQISKYLENGFCNRLFVLFFSLLLLCSADDESASLNNSVTFSARNILKVSFS